MSPSHPERKNSSLMRHTLLTIPFVFLMTACAPEDAQQDADAQIAQEGDALTGAAQAARYDGEMKIDGSTYVVRVTFSFPSSISAKQRLLTNGVPGYTPKCSDKVETTSPAGAQTRLQVWDSAGKRVVDDTASAVFRDALPNHLSPTDCVQFVKNPGTFYSQLNGTWSRPGVALKLPTRTVRFPEGGYLPIGAINVTAPVKFNLLGTTTFKDTSLGTTSEKSSEVTGDGLLGGWSMPAQITFEIGTKSQASSIEKNPVIQLKRTL